jgi:hypothetical protein
MWERQHPPFALLWGVPSRPGAARRSHGDDPPTTRQNRGRTAGCAPSAPQAPRRPFGSAALEKERVEAGLGASARRAASQRLRTWRPWRCAAPGRGCASSQASELPHRPGRGRQAWIPSNTSSLMPRTTICSLVAVFQVETTGAKPASTAPRRTKISETGSILASRWGQLSERSRPCWPCRLRRVQS